MPLISESGVNLVGSRNKKCSFSLPGFDVTEGVYAFFGTFASLCAFWPIVYTGLGVEEQ